MSGSSSIVIVNVTVQQAPTPSTLQQTGAFISQGGTTAAAGTLSLLTTVGSLTAILDGAFSISAMTWASGIVTVTTTAPHGFTIADTLNLTITGCTPAAYNMTMKLCTVTTTTQFTYALGSNPGSATVLGSYTVSDVAELVSMNTTFFAQGSSVPVYVLELGPGNPSDGVTALTTWLAANPATVYSFLVPREWSANNGFQSLCSNYTSPTSKTYFFVTPTLSNYTQYTSTQKSVFLMIEAPTIPATEFSAAAPFYVTLSANPGFANKLTPLCYSELYGVTPYPTVGNASILATLKLANANVVGTGAQGGISTAILLYGTLQDGNQWNFWYSTDWAQINLVLNLANAIINGANSQPPLSYNQAGVNRLQAVAQQVLVSGVSFNLFLGPISVSAVPFFTYTSTNPGNYKLGIYNGLAATVTPQLGFTQITFYLNISQFT